MRISHFLILGFVINLASLSFAESGSSRKSADGSKGQMKLKARSKIAETSPAISSERSDGKSSYANYLPFGAGQFSQNRYLSGAIFGGSQVLFLSLLASSVEQVNKANADVKSVMRNADPATTANDPAAAAYLNKNEKFVKQNMQNQKIFAGLFLASYGIGVLDSLNIFGPYSLSAKKKRVSEDDQPTKKSGRKSFSQEESGRGDSRVSLFYFNNEDKPAYGLNMKSEF